MHLIQQVERLSPFTMWVAMLPVSSCGLRNMLPCGHVSPYLVYQAAGTLTGLTSLHHHKAHHMSTAGIPSVSCMSCVVFHVLMWLSPAQVCLPPCLPLQAASAQVCLPPCLPPQAANAQVYLPPCAPPAGCKLKERDVTELQTGGTGFVSRDGSKVQAQKTWALGPGSGLADLRGQHTGPRSLGGLQFWN